MSVHLNPKAANTGGNENKPLSEPAQSHHDTECKTAKTREIIQQGDHWWQCNPLGTKYQICMTLCQVFQGNPPLIEKCFEKCRGIW